MKDIRDVLKENLKFYRNKANLTQQQLAEMCGFGTPYIGELEISRKDPSLKTLEKIASALNIEVYMLFYDRDREKETDSSRLKDIQDKVNQLLKKSDK